MSEDSLPGEFVAGITGLERLGESPFRARRFIIKEFQRDIGVVRPAGKVNAVCLRWISGGDYVRYGRQSWRLEKRNTRIMEEKPLVIAVKKALHRDFLFFASHRDG